MNSTRRRSRFLPRKRYLATAAVAVVGAALSFVVWDVLATREFELVRVEFDRAADERAGAIRREIEIHVGAVHALRAFYAGSERVERVEFHAFCAPILDLYRSLESLQWVPFVRAADRARHVAACSEEVPGYSIRTFDDQGTLIEAPPQDHYLPAEFAEPQLRAELGFDWSRLPAAAATCARAQSRRALAASPPIELRDGVRRVIVVAPVERDGAHAGFVMGVIDVGVLVHNALSILVDRDLQIELFDASADGEHLLVATLTDDDPGHRTPIPSYATAIPAGDRQWRFAAHALPGWATRNASSLPLLVLLGCLTSVALLTAYLATIAGRTLRVEHDVARRTRELEQEVAVRKQAERVVRASEAQLRAVMETTPDAVITCDEQAAITYFNPGAVRMFGYGKADAVGMPFSELLPSRGEEDADIVAALLSEGTKHAVGRTIELNARRADGVDFPVSLSLTSWRDSEGRGWFTGMIRDMSEHYDAEERLQSTADKLERSRAQLHAARDLADRANRAKSEFLANMSHEIRTPMNGIIGMTDLLLRGSPTPEQREHLKLVRHSAEALLRLLNDILDFSKIEAGRLELESIRFDLRDCLGDAVKSFSMLAAEKGLELACQIPPHIPDLVIGDPGRLRQIVVNLAGNAIKFTERGEVVLHVASEAANDQEVVLHFSMRDTGIGILPDKQRTIFQAFSQADSSMSRRFGGTGLGLAISSQLVRMMNGRIWVDSDAGRGSTFHFTARFGLPADAPAPRALPAELRGLRVLVADDNATHRRILEEMLAAMDLRPHGTASAEDALAAARAARRRREPFAVALLDATIAGASGFELAEQLRADLGDGLGVVLLTSTARPADRARLDAAGICRALGKPITRSDLLDAILVATGLQAAVSAAGAADDAAVRPLAILLAEDGHVNQLVAVKLLELRGHRVTVVDNGREAVRAVADGAFDVVLMDLQMPEMDGFQATAEIRRLERGTDRHLPIVAMTAHALKGDREHCLSMGMDDYLTKPIRATQLYAVVEGIAGAIDAPPAVAPPAGETAPDGPVLDLERALDRVGGNRKVLADLIDLFFDEGPKLLGEIQRAIGAQAGADLRRAAHTLKGSATIFSAHRTADAALRLENIGKTLEFQDADPAFQALEREVSELLAALVATRE